MQFQMKVDSSESPINGFLRFSKKNSNLTSSGCNGNVLENAESFYDKLSHLHESSGLNLVIDFRKTLLDLHVLYKEVVKRGGFNQVNKERGWQEVAFALKLESIDPKYGYQLQKAYALFLYQFEQMFFYRSPDKPTKATDFAGHSSYFENSSTMKQDIVEASDQKLPENSSAMKPDILEASGQKLAENSSAMKPDILEASDQKLTENSSAMKHDILEAPDQKFTDAEEVSSENEDKCDPMSTVGGPAEPKVPSPKTSIRKEKKKRPGAIMGRRTGYNIFIKQECDRLRKIRGLNYDGRTFREMAVDAWRRLSESDREQYLEESKKHKKNIMEKKTAYIEHRGMQDTDGENNVAD